MTRSVLSAVCNNESCSKCGAELVVRSRRYGPFFGYLQYPVCDYVRPLKSSAGGYIVKVLEGQICPACGANLVSRQGRFGVSIDCNGCPECKHTELIDKPNEAAIICPQCWTDYLVRRRSRCDKTFHSCDRCPECQSTISFRPIVGECPECHYPLLIKKRAVRGVKHFCASKQRGEPISVE